MFRKKINTDQIFFIKYKTNLICIFSKELPSTVVCSMFDGKWEKSFMMLRKKFFTNFMIFAQITSGLFLL